MKRRINFRNEEVWNTLTHGVGALLSISALVLMIVFSALYGETKHVICSIVFGASLIILYTASTIYHAVTGPKWKQICQKIDHLSIYLLIAGTYTPFALLGIKGTWGWTIFGIIWGLVIVGFIFKFSPLRKSEKLSLILYGLMGWLVIIAVKPMIENLSAGALWFLVAGGLFYTIGIYFYASKKIPYNHAIWHLFVLGGSVMHFFGIFFYILP